MDCRPKMNSLLRMLVISPEALVPPTHGGSLRSASLLNRLGRHMEVSVIVPQSCEEIQSGLVAEPECRNVHWISATDHKIEGLENRMRYRMEVLLQRVARRRWKGLYRDWFFGPLYSWKRVVSAHLQTIKPDIVMVEHGRHAGLLKDVARLCPKALRVVNAHNVESVLLAQVMGSHIKGRSREVVIETLEAREREFNKFCHLILCCSQEEKEKYREIGIVKPGIEVVPNGVDTQRILVRQGGTRDASRPTILFSGTLCYEPNEEGIQWFYYKIWDKMRIMIPGIRWLIVGRAPSDSLKQMVANDRDIEIHANVVSMDPYLELADVGICPLLSGSGTRLKILEAFGAGLPMVSTRLGAEGIEFDPGEHIMIADQPDDFCGAVAQLVNNQNLSERLRNSSRQLAVFRYDWDAITNHAAEALAGAVFKLRSS